MRIENNLEVAHIGKLNNGSPLKPKVYPSDGNLLEKPWGENLLWTSPLNAKYSWTNFLLTDYKIWLTNHKEYSLWKLDINPGKIAKVSSLNEYLNLINDFRDETNLAYIDWFKLSNNFDGFWLILDGLYESSNELEYNDYHRHFIHWDCESVVIFNTDIITSMTKLPQTLQLVI